MPKGYKGKTHSGVFNIKEEMSDIGRFLKGITVKCHYQIFEVKHDDTGHLGREMYRAEGESRVT